MRRSVALRIGFPITSSGECRSFYHPNAYSLKNQWYSEISSNQAEIIIEKNKYINNQSRRGYLYIKRLILSRKIIFLDDEETETHQGESRTESCKQER